ncbi:MAG TPA: 16S rRNA (guanine(527)-N(7))-methyltransferase RsmG [Sporichthyaceae bacterium]|jgi:16S rRNA (guanine527-N7)-methyltransferase
MIEQAEGAVPAPPPAALDLLGDQLPVMVRYAAALADAGVVRGLIGPREVPRLWERHLLNCAVLAGEVAPGERLADVGSGAGLPGLVLAILRRDLDVVLIDPLLRRTVFLEEMVAALGLTNVAVRRARAQDCPDLRGRFDVVTARAVAPLPTLLDWSLPLLRGGGRLLAVKGEAAEAEVAEVRAGKRDRAVESINVRAVGAGFVDTPTTVVELRLRADHAPAAPVNRRARRSNVSRETGR